MNPRPFTRTFDAAPVQDETRRRETVTAPAGQVGEEPLRYAALEGEADRLAASIAAGARSPGRGRRPARGGEPRAAEAEASLHAVRPAAERALGHDFGRLSVHADPAAAAEARRLDAIAFTLGRDVFLDPDALPRDAARRDHVLAHELAHVAQQSGGRVPAATLQRQRRPRPAPVDADAQRIIELAQDASRSLADRGPAVVRAIVNQYNASDASKIAEIVYREAQDGLLTTSRGRGPNTTGVITVGRDFVEHTDQANFARRVAQVRHEIEHIDQYRAGMAGANRSDEREFQAFYHEALSTAPAGAGRMQHSTRVRLLDAALGYYCCLSEELRRANATKQQELLDRRVEEVRRSGNTDLGDPPTSCRRQAP